VHSSAPVNLALILSDPTSYRGSSQQITVVAEVRATQQSPTPQPNHDVHVGAPQSAVARIICQRHEGVQGGARGLSGFANRADNGDGRSLPDKADPLVVGAGLAAVSWRILDCRFQDLSGLERAKRAQHSGLPGRRLGLASHSCDVAGRRPRKRDYPMRRHSPCRRPPPWPEGGTARGMNLAP
jgi:hypothetical protein